MYLYWAVDKAGKTVDFFLSRTRDVNAAKTFLRKAVKGQRMPTKITLDAGATIQPDRLASGSPVVAYLISQYPTINHTFVLDEVRGLRKLGLEIRVASVRGPDRLPETLNPKESEEYESAFYIRPSGVIAALLAHINVSFSRPKSYAKGLFQAILLSDWSLLVALQNLRFFSEALVLGMWMERNEIKWLHTHFASTVALFARFVFPIHMSATIHGSDEFKDGARFLLREKVHAAEFIVAISFYGKGQLMRFSDHTDWPKLRVVRLGVNTSDFGAGRSAKQEGRPFELLCVGRLASPKTHLVLLQACAELVREGRNVQLSLVGDGPDRSYLEEAATQLNISEQVIFHGSVRHDHVLEHYRRADMFTLASVAEGVPVVLMEAMAMELPCVATAITGIPELIQNEREGLLVPPADLDSFTNAIRRLMDDPELCIRLGIAARKKVLKLYDLEKNVATLRGVFQTR